MNTTDPQILARRFCRRLTADPTYASAVRTLHNPRSLLAQRLAADMVIVERFTDMLREELSKHPDRLALAVLEAIELFLPEIFPEPCPSPLPQKG